MMDLAKWLCGFIVVLCLFWLIGIMDSQEAKEKGLVPVIMERLYGPMQSDGTSVADSAKTVDLNDTTVAGE